jgi:hypothetical protein
MGTAGSRSDELQEVAENVFPAGDSDGVQIRILHAT